jgi:hypothetical protein
MGARLAREEAEWECTHGVKQVVSDDGSMRQ